MKRFTEAIMFIFYIIPIAVLLLWSFTDRLPWPELLPKGLNTTAWISILTDKGFLEALLNSVGISLAVTFLAIVISLPTAYCLLSYSFRGKAALNLLFILPFVIPTISLSIGAHSFYMFIGLTDTYIGVILAHLLVALPYSIRLIASGMELLGSNLGNQAKTLGANTMQTLTQVYLPNLKPAVMASGVLVFIVSFSQYILTFMVGGGAIKTLPILIFPVMQNGSRAEVSVYSLIFLGCALLSVMLIEKTLHKQMGSEYYTNI